MEHKIKFINSILFWIAFSLIACLLLETFLKIEILSMVKMDRFGNFLLYYLLIFAFLSLVSIFKSDLFFNKVPYNFHIFYLVMIFLLFVVGIFWSENL